MKPMMVHYPFLADLINKENITSFVEVGVWKGHLSHCMLTRCPCLTQSYAVDPYLHQDPKIYKDRANVKQSEFDSIYAEAALRLSEFGSRNELLRKSSVDAALHLKDKQFDFIFIDANHDFEWVTKDLKAWYPMVKPGMFFGGHDYGHRRFPGVKMAVDNFCERKNMSIETMPGYVWYARKVV